MVEKSMVRSNCPSPPKKNLCFLEIKGHVNGPLISNLSTPGKAALRSPSYRILEIKGANPR